MEPLAVVALGGNVLVRDAQHQSIADQYEVVQQLAPCLADLIEAGWRLLVTHGNGPQAGFILRRSELAEHEVSPVPLDYVVGDTQGAMGYMFVAALGNELRRRGRTAAVAAVVTLVVVDAGDDAFARPSKPVGAFMDETTAARLAELHGWSVMEDAHRGWRRTVPSPAPVEIVELSTIATLVDAGVVVVAGGGGGIPVVRDEHGHLEGVEAVVDKDLTSMLLAVGLGADLLLLCTGVERVAVGFGTPAQRWLDTLDLAEARRLSAQGEFGEGSMQPKVDAAVAFVSRRPGGVAVITSPERIAGAAAGRAGTRITG